MCQNVFKKKRNKHNTPRLLQEETISTKPVFDVVDTLKLAARMEASNSQTDVDRDRYTKHNDLIKNLLNLDFWSLPDADYDSWVEWHCLWDSDCHTGCYNPSRWTNRTRSAIAELRDEVSFVTQMIDDMVDSEGRDLLQHHKSALGVKLAQAEHVLKCCAHGIFDFEVAELVQKYF